MRPISQTRTRVVRAVLGAVAVAAAVVIPAGSAAAADGSSPALTQTRDGLPPGVVRLNDGEPCPVMTLCLYRDYGFEGPAYGIGAGYNVNLHELPMDAPGGSAANNVSSWINRTDGLAILIDTDDGVTRPLFPRQQLQEPPQYNDTVDEVNWA